MIKSEWQWHYFFMLKKCWSSLSTAAAWTAHWISGSHCDWCNFREWPHISLDQGHWMITSYLIKNWKENWWHHNPGVMSIPPETESHKSKWEARIIRGYVFICKEFRLTGVIFSHHFCICIISNSVNSQYGSSFLSGNYTKHFLSSN